MARIPLGVRLLLCVALALLSVGCAPAYRAYRLGCHDCVEYGYCPPAPLPYTTYCGCPTPVASGFASRSVPTAQDGGSHAGPRPAIEATLKDSNP